jgi:hypothetical protein
MKIGTEPLQSLTQTHRSKLNLSGFRNLIGFFHKQIFCAQQPNPSSASPGDLNLMAATDPKHEGYSEQQD